MSERQLPRSSLAIIKKGIYSYLIAGAAVAAVTAVMDVLRIGTFANACMLYLLVVMFIALILGSVPAVVSSVLSVLAFDWFFVQPVHTFTVREPTEWLALCVFLLVSIIVGQLTAMLQKRAEEARALVVQKDNLMKVQARAEALAEADRLKTALLSMVSHDFRSPLTSIKASVGSLISGGASMGEDTQRSLLQGIEEETDRLNRLVGNILDLSRLEAGAWRPHRETTSITELVGAALDCFNQEENSRIDVTLSNDAKEIWVDSVQMVQVLKNLLENALKYSPSGSRVELAIKPEGSQLAIEVIDNGPGLPPGEEAQIFESFYRAPAVKESSVPGMGVGLAICLGLVEAHGGNLTAHNGVAGGAVFRVTLPIAAADERLNTLSSS